MVFPCLIIHSWYAARSQIPFFRDSLQSDAYMPFFWHSRPFYTPPTARFLGRSEITSTLRSTLVSRYGYKGQVGDTHLETSALLPAMHHKQYFCMARLRSLALCLPLPSLKGYKGQSVCEHSSTSFTLQSEQSRHLSRIALRRLRLTVLVDVSWALIVTFTFFHSVMFYSRVVPDRVPIKACFWFFNPAPPGPSL